MLLLLSRQRTVETICHLYEIWLDTNAESIDNRTETIEHDLIFRGLLLERIDNAVDETDLEPLVDIQSTEHSDNFCDCLHDHLLVWLGFIFQVIDDSANDLRQLRPSV
jgi:hypothetical protein